MMTYFEDARCSLSNNLSEQKMKSYVIGRKGWLFSDSSEGAEASAISYSIAETALANGLNVYKYITYVLEKRPTEEMADSELEKLLPWNDKVFEMCKIEIQIKIDTKVTGKSHCSDNIKLYNKVY